MRFQRWATGVLMAMGLSVSALAEHAQLQVPQCLASKITIPHYVLATDKEFKIIDVNANDLNNLVLLADQVHCGRFVNITHKFNKITPLTVTAKKILQQPKPALRHENSTVYKIRHENEVGSALNQIVSDNIWQTLTHLTSYYNRYSRKDTGVETAKWLQSSFEALATQYGRTDTTTFLVKTGGYKQPSLVTVIGKDIKAPAIVLGAHMDTLNGRKPGAGDDGSGSSSLMEAARVLLASKMTLKRPIYVIWYAAEEEGLVGSQYVVDYFKDHDISVAAALQLDMTGYRGSRNEPTMWVYEDYTDKSLSTFLVKLITYYVKVPVDFSSCGYGCSDHASWHDIGVPAAFPVKPVLRMSIPTFTLNQIQWNYSVLII